MAVIFWGNFGPLFQNVDSLRHPDLSQPHGLNSLLLVKEETLQENLDVIEKAARDPNLTIAVAYDNNIGKAQIPMLYAHNFINHIIPTDSDNSRRLIASLQTHSFGPDLFQPQSLLSKRERTLDHSKHFDDIYAEISNYLAELKCFLGFEGIVLTVASELLTNAFYNGKKDSKTGQPMVTDRKIKFALDNKQHVSLTYGYDAEYFWLGVSDPFGTLDRQILVKSMNRAAVEKTPKTDTPGGAGLGMMMLFDWATEMIVNIDSGRSTNVLCKFKLTQRNRIFETEPSSLHIFERHSQERT